MQLSRYYLEFMKREPLAMDPELFRSPGTFSFQSDPPVCPITEIPGCASRNCELHYMDALFRVERAGNYLD